MEIINTAQLETYLDMHNIPFSSLQLLEGGSANFVWRLVDEPGMYNSEVLEANWGFRPNPALETCLVALTWRL